MSSPASGSPSGWKQFCVSGVPSGQAAGLWAWLQMATVPKLAIATPANLSTAIPALAERPAFRWPSTPRSVTKA